MLWLKILPRGNPIVVWSGPDIFIFLRTFKGCKAQEKDPDTSVLTFSAVIFIYLFIYFIYLFLLYNIVLVLPHINMNPPRVYTCSLSWTPPPTSLPVSSLWVIPVHQPQASCTELGLEIHFLYDIIHVSMPFSQIIPPSPSPTESKRLFYTSMSLLLSHIQGYRYHLSKFHIYLLVYCIGVFLSGLLHSV